MSEHTLLGALGGPGPAGLANRPEALCAALGLTGKAAAHVAGPLAVASAPPDETPPGTARTLCLLDGSITNLATVATDLGLDPGMPVEQVLALGYERFGDAVTERLQGSFLVLLWDRDHRQGLLVGDPLGARPLFLINKGPSLMFASEIGPLLKILPSRPPADPIALAHWLARRLPPPGLTLFDGVRRLPAGHMVRLSEDGCKVQRWWHPRYREPTSRPVADAAAELRGEMTAAVQRALGDAEVAGIRLSGGFDSGSIAAITASTIDVDRLRSYSVVYPHHPEADESARIAQLRSHLGIQGIERRFRGGSALSAAAEFIAIWAVPPSSPNWFASRPLIKHAATDGVEILLDGNGGDELFGCSPNLLADLLMRGRFLALMTTARRIPGMGSSPSARRLWRGLRIYALRGALPPRAHTIARRGRAQRRGGPPWLAEDSFEQVLAAEQRYAWKELPGPRWWAASVNALVYVPDALGGADELRREARMDGVAFGHPWRDPGLVEYMLAQPPELSFDPIRDRPLAREAVRGLMPDPGRLNEVKPHFNILLQDSLAGPDASAVGDLLLNPPDQLMPHLRGSEVPALLERRQELTGALDVWRLATAALWLRSEADPDSLSQLQ